MIQELLGNSGGGSIDKCMGEERSKMVNPNSGDNTNGGSSSQDHQQQLRCPRCDSSNTKFCYYNNYNLTQPRHFCKTCRRYWTKGGALRNVPIGGGCRKNKSSATNSGGSSASKSGKVKSEPSKSVADHETASSQFLWASGQNSHLFDVGGMAASQQQQQQALSLALLRASTQNPNPNPNSCSNPNSMVIKEEGLMIGSQQLMSEPVASVLNSQNLTLDHMNHQVGIAGGSLWRNNSNQQQQQQQQGLFLGEVQGGGIQELYQRLRASASFCNNDYNSHSHSHPHHHHHHHHHQVLNNTGGSSIMDPTPLPSSTELGYWNSPLLSWSDLHTTNGAFP